MTTTEITTAGQTTAYFPEYVIVAQAKDGRVDIYETSAKDFSADSTPFHSFAAGINSIADLVAAFSDFVLSDE